MSATSITIGQRGQAITATVTAATVVSGKTRRISGVKAGDMVLVSITRTDGACTATAIQDPASGP